jgi:hypothetical protein
MIYGHIGVESAEKWRNVMGGVSNVTRPRIQDGQSEIRLIKYSVDFGTPMPQLGVYPNTPSLSHF